MPKSTQPMEITSTNDPLICIMFCQDDSYNEVVDAANDAGGSTHAVVAHLAQGDYGEENDSAARINGYTQREELERGPHQIHEVEHGGLHYWLQLDHHIGIYGLYRRPLSQVDEGAHR